MECQTPIKVLLTQYQAQMLVLKGERLFGSLSGDIGTTIFSYDFIQNNSSTPCVQASIDQWIGDWTCTLEVRGSNLAHDKPFILLLSCIFLSIIFEKYFVFHFFRPFTHFNTHYDTISWYIHNFEFIKFRSAFASLCIAAQCVFRNIAKYC